MTFTNDLRVGKIGESALTNLLEQAGYTTEIPSNDKKSHYDILARKDAFRATFEVKLDKFSAISGNIALETFNPISNKDSGLAISEADIWCEVLPDEYGHNSIWMCSLDRLKTFIEKNPPFKTVKKAGDGNANIMLYKMDFLLSIFTRVDNVPVQNIEKIIKRLKKEK